MENHWEDERLMQGMNKEHVWHWHICLPDTGTYAYKRSGGQQTNLVDTSRQQAPSACFCLTALWISVETFKQFVSLLCDRDIRLTNLFGCFTGKHTYCIFETMFLWFLLIFYLVDLHTWKKLYLQAYVYIEVFLKTRIQRLTSLI